MSTSGKHGFTTANVHSDHQKPIEHASLLRPIHNSVTFGYADSRQLAEVFQGKQPGYRYARQGNPSISALEDKITRMEDGIATVCFASGMAAIGSVPLTLLRAGDHVVSSVFLFGNTSSIWQTVGHYGIDVSQVDATDVKNIEAALRPSTRMVYVETIANPRTQIADLKRIGELCRARGLLFVVDNTMTTPYLFRPKAVGASLSVNSLTKSINGHGNAMGGAVTDTGLFDWSRYPNIFDSVRKNPPTQWGAMQIRTRGLRDFGACLSPETAHRISTGAETLALRMDRTCANALAIAEMLEADSRVKAVYYPGLSSHPQHALASELFRAGGSMFSFELKDGIDCCDYIDRLKLAIPASNLGDTRTLAIPVAQTIYADAGAEARANMGIADNLIRVSIGIEDTADLVEDFRQALGA
ncbi:MAG: cystathionine gamma-synthase family protein [Burkholderiaceae bacterium]|nr:cystathionine gamma-synthase family protein [Burkholderiaceae bacterium]